MTQRTNKPPMAPVSPTLDKPKTDDLQSFNKGEKAEVLLESKEVVNESRSEDPPVENNFENKPVSLTFNQIASRWPLILKQVAESNYSLGLSLSVAKPLSLNGNILTLGFLFGLQKDKVDKATSLEIIEKIISTELGMELKLELMVDASLKLSDITNGDRLKNVEITIEQQETKDPVKQALQAFGGSLVSKI
jgi:hypothetical protein